MKLVVHQIDPGCHNAQGSGRVDFKLVGEVNLFQAKTKTDEDEKELLHQL